MSQNLRQIVAALATAGAALAGPALAQTADCDLAGAGLPETLDRYLPAAQTCLTAPPAGVSALPGLEEATVEALNAQRHESGRKALTVRPALAEAARLHAIDMAVRGYAAHIDPEGRGHLDRMRAMDRTGLIGSAGGNVAILTGADAEAIAASLFREGENRDNVLRTEFTDLGVGVAEADGRTFAVAVFARLDGELDQPLPVAATRIASLRSNLDREDYPAAGLRLASADGRVLAESRTGTITTPGTGEDAYLDIAVEQGGEILYLRGPMVHTGG